MPDETDASGQGFTVERGIDDRLVKGEQPAAKTGIVRSVKKSNI
jgi:hypothetical protein